MLFAVRTLLALSRLWPSSPNTADIGPFRRKTPHRLPHTASRTARRTITVKMNSAQRRFDAL